MKKNKVNKTGFTLIELLIVVLIIGILSATALPMYKKAVEKSRVTDALTTMGAVAKSEHAWYLEHSNYTDDFANLDIDLTGEIEDEQLKTSFYNYELLDTGILAERNNGEYLIYKDYETNQILCTPGTHYICEDLGAFTKVPCEKVGMAWANTNSTCYADNEARCKGLYPDDNFWNGSYCGYPANVQKKEFNEGMECRGTCMRNTFNDGAICLTSVNDVGCKEGYYNGGFCIGKEGTRNSCNASTYINGGICYGVCSYSSVSAGGICMGIEDNSCRNAQVYDGGVAVCQGEASCKWANFYGTGCCCGSSPYCSTSKACDPDRCTEVLSMLDTLETLQKTMPNF